DVLVTSGLGQRFPAGYRVGVISSIVHDSGKPFANVLVEPSARIDRSRNLLLVFEDRPAIAINNGGTVQVPVAAQASSDTGDGNAPAEERPDDAPAEALRPAGEDD